MSFVKLINAGDFHCDQAVAELVPLHSRGVDRAWMIKRASGAAESMFDGLQPEPGHTLIHLIAMGASDRYGPNRNGDFFYRTGRSLDIPSPNWDSVRLPDGSIEKRSADNFRDSTRVGLLETYDTFESHARVFRDHKNRPNRGDKVHGEVKRSKYNDEMDRVELAISVPTDSWSSDLNKIASGELVPFSMACVADPGALVLTCEGYTPICRVRPGELVMTHRGRWRPVVALTTRKYTGQIHRLQLTGYVRKLDVTTDHPLLAVKIEAGAADEPVRPNWLHAVHLSAEDHALLSLGYLQSPDEGLLVGRDSAEDVTQPHLAYFLGQCVADPMGLSAYERGLFVGDNGEKSGHALCLALGMSTECRAAFAAGVVDFATTCGVENCEQPFYGDDDRFAIITLDSEEVALLFSHVLSSLGINSALTRYKGADKGSVALCISTAFAQACRKYSTVAKCLLDRSAETDQSGEEYESDTFRPVTIESVETFKVENLTVYNLEVSEDHSYVIQGIVSHNCKIAHDICSECGHTAPSRERYCPHLTSQLTKLTKSANLIGAVNDEMTFFDISRVNRPADRIAYALTKAASMASGVAQTPDDVELEAAVLERARLYASPDSTERARWLGKCRKLASESFRFQPTLFSYADSTATKLASALPARARQLDADVLRYLAAGGATLPFRAFAKLAFAAHNVDQAVVDEAARFAHRSFDPSVMGESLEHACLDDAFKCSSYQVGPVGSLVEVAGLLDPSRAGAVAAGREVKLAFEKSAGAPSDTAMALLKTYARYKAASLADIASLRGHDIAQRAAMLSVAIDLCEVAV